MRLFKEYIRNSKGVAAIEFAIVLPVYLLFIFGIIELGYVLWGDSALKYGASYGARYAFVNPTSTATTIKNYALAKTSFSAGGPINYTATIVPNSYVNIDGTFTYTFYVLPISPLVINVHLHQVLAVNT